MLNKIMSHLRRLRPVAAKAAVEPGPVQERGALAAALSVDSSVVRPFPGWGTPEQPLERSLQAAAATTLPFLSPGAGLGDTEARIIQEHWASHGGYAVSNSGRCRMTSGYQAWKQRVELFLSMPPLELRDMVEGWRRWLGDYEAHARWAVSQKGMVLRSPGPIPFELASQLFEDEPLGGPPAVSFRPIRVYSVKLPGGARYSFHDDPVLLGGKSVIHEAGISRIGVKLHKRPELESLLTGAGILDATERKVMKKIAGMESGFEAINTCDPEEISVGFVPFASGELGDGPLFRLLKSMKAGDPGEFDSYFRGHGIDVGVQGLVVVHLDRGCLLRGREAVQAIRDDKRLTAVFQNAGEKSRAYQLAQLRLAHELYYLASQDFMLRCQVRSRGRALVITLLGRYGDVLRSEAGKVAIMDRAVHRGVENARQTFHEACTAVLQERGLTTLRALAEHEAFITPLLQPPARIRVMEDPELSQPSKAPEV